jgi:hypothetical protein
MNSNPIFELYEKDIVELNAISPQPSLTTHQMTILPNLPTYPSKIPKTTNYNHHSISLQAPWHLMPRSFILQDAAKPDIIDFIDRFLRNNQLSYIYDNFQEAFVISIEDLTLNIHLYDNIGQYTRTSAGNTVSGIIVESYSLNRMTSQMELIYRTLRESLTSGTIHIVEYTQSNPESIL